MNGEKSPNIIFQTAKKYLEILLGLSKALFTSYNENKRSEKEINEIAEEVKSLENIKKKLDSLIESGQLKPNADFNEFCEALSEEEAATLKGIVEKRCVSQIKENDLAERLMIRLAMHSIPSDIIKIGGVYCILAPQEYEQKVRQEERSLNNYLSNRGKYGIFEYSPKDANDGHVVIKGVDSSLIGMPTFEEDLVNAKKGIYIQYTGDPKHCNIICDMSDKSFVLHELANMELYSKIVVGQYEKMNTEANKKTDLKFSSKISDLNNNHYFYIKDDCYVKVTPVGMQVVAIDNDGNEKVNEDKYIERSSCSAKDFLNQVKQTIRHLNPDGALTNVAYFDEETHKKYIKATKSEQAKMRGEASEGFSIDFSQETIFEMAPQNRLFEIVHNVLADLDDISIQAAFGEKGLKYIAALKLDEEFLSRLANAKSQDVYDRIVKEWEDCYKNSDRKPNIPSKEEVEMLAYEKRAESDKTIDIFVDELFSNRQDEIKESLKNIFTNTNDTRISLKEMVEFTRNVELISNNAQDRYNTLTNEKGLEQTISEFEHAQPSHSAPEKDAGAR